MFSHVIPSLFFPFLSKDRAPPTNLTLLYTRRINAAVEIYHSVLSDNPKDKLEGEDVGRVGKRRLERETRVIMCECDGARMFWAPYF